MDHAATIRSALSRWEHGFEPRWDCSSFVLVREIYGASSRLLSGNFVRISFLATSEGFGKLAIVPRLRRPR
jgi:hypothetical protein